MSKIIYYYNSAKLLGQKVKCENFTKATPPSPTHTHTHNDHTAGMHKGVANNYN